MSDLLDGVAAVLLFGVLNLLLVARVGASRPSGDGPFLVRVYLAAVLLREPITLRLGLGVAMILGGTLLTIR